MTNCGARGFGKKEARQGENSIPQAFHSISFSFFPNTTPTLLRILGLRKYFHNCRVKILPNACIHKFVGRRNSFYPRPQQLILKTAKIFRQHPWHWRGCARCPCCWAHLHCHHKRCGGVRHLMPPPQPSRQWTES